VEGEVCSFILLLLGKSLMMKFSLRCISGKFTAVWSWCVIVSVQRFSLNRWGAGGFGDR